MRFYDPQTGRYTEADPIGLEGGANLYTYVRGNPLGRVDPKGLVEVLPGPVPLPIPLPIPITPSGSKGGSQGNNSGGLFPPAPQAIDPSEITPIVTTPPNFPTQDPSKCDKQFDDDVDKCKNTCGRADVSRYWCLAKAYLRLRACKRIYNPAGSNWTDE
jgi:uncharacterized protein RhaS with RHS repeats